MGNIPASFFLLVSFSTPVSQAAAFLSVAQALENQNNSVQTVKGYVVGQPTGTSTVITSNYPNDYALALADSSNETNTDKMVYVRNSFKFAKYIWTSKSLGVKREKSYCYGHTHSLFFTPRNKISYFYQYRNRRN